MAKGRLFVSMSETVIAELDRRAQLDNRSTSNYLETILIRHFQQNPLRPIVAPDLWATDGDEDEDEDLSA